MNKTVLRNVSLVKLALSFLKFSWKPFFPNLLIVSIKSASNDHVEIKTEKSGNKNSQKCIYSFAPDERKTYLGK